MGFRSLGYAEVIRWKDSKNRAEIGSSRSSANTGLAAALVVRPGTMCSWSAGFRRHCCPRCRRSPAAVLAVGSPKYALSLWLARARKRIFKEQTTVSAPYSP